MDTKRGYTMMLHALSYPPITLVLPTWAKEIQIKKKKKKKKIIVQWSLTCQYYYVKGSIQCKKLSFFTFIKSNNTDWKNLISSFGEDNNTLTDTKNIEVQSNKPATLINKTRRNRDQSLQRKNGKAEWNNTTTMRVN